MVDSNEERIEVDTIAKVPKALAQEYDLITTSENSGHLTVVTSNSLDFYGIEDVHLVTGMNISACLCEKTAINRTIDYYYTKIKTRETANMANENVVSSESDDIESYNPEEDDTSVVELFNNLLTRSYNVSTSDIHIKPFEDKTMVRMCIDSMIVDHV